MITWLNNELSKNLHFRKQIIKCKIGTKGPMKFLKVVLMKVLEVVLVIIMKRKRMMKVIKEKVNKK